MSANFNNPSTGSAKYRTRQGLNLTGKHAKSAKWRERQLRLDFNSKPLAFSPEIRGRVGFENPTWLFNLHLLLGCLNLRILIIEYKQPRRYSICSSLRRSPGASEKTETGRLCSFSSFALTFEGGACGRQKAIILTCQPPVLLLKKKTISGPGSTSTSAVYLPLPSGAVKETLQHYKHLILRSHSPAPSLGCCMFYLCAVASPLSRSLSQKRVAEPLLLGLVSWKEGGLGDFPRRARCCLSVRLLIAA